MSPEEELFAMPTEELEDVVRLNAGTDVEPVLRRVLKHRSRVGNEIEERELHSLGLLGGEFASVRDKLEFAREIGFPMIAIREDGPGVGYDWVRHYRPSADMHHDSPIAVVDRDPVFGLASQRTRLP
jgi:hypothetical protein